MPAMKRMLCCLMLSSSVIWCATACADSDPNADMLTALKPFAPFVGSWKGTGTSQTSSGWTETGEVSWGFRKSDGRVSINFFPEKNPYFTAGLLTYDLESKQYQFIAKTKGDEKITLTGKREGQQGVRLTREKGDKWDRLDLKFARAGDKVIFQFGKRRGSSAENVATIEWIREGKSEEEFAKGPRCVVTSGAGRVEVMHDGQPITLPARTARKSSSPTPASTSSLINPKRRTSQQANPLNHTRPRKVSCQFVHSFLARTTPDFRSIRACFAADHPRRNEPGLQQNQNARVEFPVTGVVMVADQPLTNGAITFIPEIAEEQGGRPAWRSCCLMARSRLGTQTSSLFQACRQASIKSRSSIR